MAILGGATAILVALLGPVAFLFRKSHRVKHLKWRLEDRIAILGHSGITSVINRVTTGLSDRPLSLDGIIAASENPEILSQVGTLAHRERVHRVVETGGEYWFWERILRLERAPDRPNR